MFQLIKLTLLPVFMACAYAQSPVSPTEANAVVNAAKWNGEYVEYTIQPESFSPSPPLSWYLEPASTQLKAFIQVYKVDVAPLADKQSENGALLRVHRSVFQGKRSFRYEQLNYNRTFATKQECRDELSRIKSQPPHPFIRLNVKKDCERTRVLKNSGYPFYLNTTEEGDEYVPAIEVHLRLPEMVQ